MGLPFSRPSILTERGIEGKISSHYSWLWRLRSHPPRLLVSKKPSYKIYLGWSWFPNPHRESEREEWIKQEKVVNDRNDERC